MTDFTVSRSWDIVTYDENGNQIVWTGFENAQEAQDAWQAMHPNDTFIGPAQWPDSTISSPYTET